MVISFETGMCELYVGNIHYVDINFIYDYEDFDNINSIVLQWNIN